MKTYSILDFGAVTGSDELCTRAIQDAVDACFLAGGGEVTIPGGEFKCGSFRLRSNVTLHLLEDAHLKGSRDPEDYVGALTGDKAEPIPEDEKTDVLWTPAATRKNHDHLRKIGSRWHNALITAAYGHDIAIIGERGSEIDGSNCYDSLGEEHYRGPHAVSFFKCRNITLRGYTVRDSGNWANILLYTDNILIEKITVLAGHDGVHMHLCSNARIADCDFYTGDDCIAGYANVNVDIENCLMNTACSGMRFGGTDVYVHNCSFIGPAKFLFRGSLTDEEKRSEKTEELGENHRYNMLSAFTYYADFSFEIPLRPGNIVLENCEIKNTDRLIHYNFSGNEVWQKGRPLHDIALRHVNAEGIGMPLNLYGSESEPLSLELTDVSISLRDGFVGDEVIRLCHYKDIVLNDVRVTGTPECFIKRWSDDGEIDVRNVKFDRAPKDMVKDAEEEFHANAI